MRPSFARPEKRIRGRSDTEPTRIRRHTAIIKPWILQIEMAFVSTLSKVIRKLYEAGPLANPQFFASNSGIKFTNENRRFCVSKYASVCPGFARSEKRIHPMDPRIRLGSIVPKSGRNLGFYRSKWLSCQCFSRVIKTRIHRGSIADPSRKPIFYRSKWVSGLLI